MLRKSAVDTFTPRELSIRFGGPMSFRPVKRFIKSKLTLERSDVLLHGQFGFGSSFELNPFLLLEDPHNDILSWAMENRPDEAEFLSASDLMSPGN